MKAIEKAIQEYVDKYNDECFDAIGGECPFIKKAFKAGAEWQKKQEIDKVVRWKKNSDENKPVINHSVLIKSTYGIAEGEWDGEQWIQYRWQSKIKDCDVQYWMELSDLEK